MSLRKRKDVTNVVGDDGRTRRRIEEEGTPNLKHEHAKKNQNIDGPMNQQKAQRLLRELEARKKEAISLLDTWPNMGI